MIAARWMRLTTLLLLGAVVLFPQRKKKKDEDLTQVLEVPKDPPAAVTAETRRLQFVVTPLTAKGLLSQQMRDTLKALLRQVGGTQVVKIRAFVAGSGDLRRVPAIVSEVFTEKKLALPAVSVVQVGGLPLEGAQVVLEATTLAKKDVNGAGLLFVSGQQHTTPKPVEPVAPLVRKSLDGIRTVVTAAGATPGDVLRVTCFLSTLNDLAQVRPLVAAEFAGAAANFVQVERASPRSIAECEAVARLPKAGAAPLEFLNPAGLEKSPNYSQAAAVTADKVVLTGLQVAFQFQDSDTRLAFQRLQKVLEANGTSMKHVAMSSVYPLAPSIADSVRRVRFEYYDKERPPASTMLGFEGLPGMDAAFGVDVVAVPR